MTCIAPGLWKNQGAWTKDSRQDGQMNEDRLTENSVSLNDVWKWEVTLRILTCNEFQTLIAKNRKARNPQVTLWRETESWWELDERRDLVGSWYCKRSERYGGDGRPVCKALKVKVASLNRIRHSIGSQWSWLRSSVEDNGDERDCRYKATRAAAYWIRWEASCVTVCLSGVPYRMDRVQLIKARRNECWCDVGSHAVI